MNEEHRETEPPREAYEEPREGYVYDLDDESWQEDGAGPRLLDRLQQALDGTVPHPRSEPHGVSRASGAGDRSLRQRIATDPDTVERDLIKLILTVVELVRQLMERQALRRVEQGDLSDEQEERIGVTLMLLEERMTELRERYDLTVDDLNLDLGPLGSLLPRNGGGPDR
ncbi:gas vesicle protein K [Nocardiopsis ganjiahuensis]|uniref:gas vesicle protein K n=1 Tax=Nocardiopsis ganjiahuensis TaxID=239984 RepID=UPI0003471993|nr:gas vesicle protein K [Nocardiopsis ganjiahuensis]